MRPNACAKPSQIDAKRTGKDIDGIFYSKYRDLYDYVPPDVIEIETYNINSDYPADFEEDGELINKAIHTWKTHTMYDQIWVLRWGNYFVNDSVIAEKMSEGVLFQW